MGLGTTNEGKNPTKDPAKEFGNTPTGEAAIDEVVDLDPQAEFVTTEGTPINSAQGDVPASLEAFGRFFIGLDPESGLLKESGRTGIEIHGGRGALEAQQKLRLTHGCLRCSNQTAAQLAKQIKNAKINNRVFRVIIKDKKTK